MRNGPVLWEEILMVARSIGNNPIIAGGAVRDYVILKSTPKDIDVFLSGPVPDSSFIEGMIYQDQQIDQFEEYMDRGGILAIREYTCEISPCPIQFIWIDGDPVQYVKGFDLGTSQCYYRGAVVLGKNFLHDWHHQTITILPQAFERAGGVGRSRDRARILQQKYPNGATIREEAPPDHQRVLEEQIVNAAGMILPADPNAWVNVVEWGDPNFVRLGLEVIQPENNEENEAAEQVEAVQQPDPMFRFHDWWEGRVELQEEAANRRGLNRLNNAFLIR